MEINCNPRGGFILGGEWSQPLPCTLIWKGVVETGWRRWKDPPLTAVPIVQVPGLRDSTSTRLRASLVRKARTGQLLTRGTHGMSGTHPSGRSDFPRSPSDGGRQSRTKLLSTLRGNVCAINEVGRHGRLVDLVWAGGRKVKGRVEAQSDGRSNEGRLGRALSQLRTARKLVLHNTTSTHPTATATVGPRSSGISISFRATYHSSGADLGRERACCCETDVRGIRPNAEGWCRVHLTMWIPVV